MPPKPVPMAHWCSLLRLIVIFNAQQITKVGCVLAWFSRLLLEEFYQHPLNSLMHSSEWIKLCLMMFTRVSVPTAEDSRNIAYSFRSWLCAWHAQIITCVGLYFTINRLVAFIWSCILVQVFSFCKGNKHTLLSVSLAALSCRRGTCELLTAEQVALLFFLTYCCLSSLSYEFLQWLLLPNPY